MSNTVVEVGATVLAGLGALTAALLYIRRAFKRFCVDFACSDAERSVIEMLRSEVERLAAANTSLSAAVIELQNDVVCLRSANAELLQQIDELQRDNTRLSQQIEEFIKILDTHNIVYDNG
jgi:FtsZ-binding cell division protein ZapB